MSGEVPSRDWRARPLADLLAEHGLGGRPEHDFPTDGWSGARFTFIERPGDPPERFVVKRTSAAVDWIAAATADTMIREAWLANALASPMVGPVPGWPTAYLGAASDEDGAAAILMPDLSVELIAWERPDHVAVADPAVVGAVLAGLADLHGTPWPRRVDAADSRPATDPPFPWCPLAERLTLTARPTCLQHVARGIPAGVGSAGRLIAGWDAFDQRSSRAARDLIAALGEDVTPLVAALGRLPSAGLHGDVKLANVAVWPATATVRMIDWQMTIRAPVAVELGWFLVANTASLPETPDRILGRYHDAALAVATSRRMPVDDRAIFGDWDAQVDLGWIVGLLLRGWRKGLDAAAGATLGSGVSAAQDLAEWSELAVEAAARRL